MQNERSKNHSIPFIALTETWLKSYIKDAQLHIPNYVVSRSDRDKHTGGGVLLFSHQNIPVSEKFEFDDGICQGLICKFDTVKMYVIAAYRPPDASNESSAALIEFMSSMIEMGDHSYTLCITGDFNFPNIDWDTFSVSSGGQSDSYISGKRFLLFVSDKFLNQLSMCQLPNTKFKYS